MNWPQAPTGKGGALLPLLSLHFDQHASFRSQASCKAGKKLLQPSLTRSPTSLQLQGGHVTYLPPFIFNFQAYLPSVPANSLHQVNLSLVGQHLHSHLVGDTTSGSS